MIVWVFEGRCVVPTTSLVACVVGVEDLLPQLAGVRVEHVETDGEFLRVAAVTGGPVPAVVAHRPQVSQAAELSGPAVGAVGRPPRARGRGCHSNGQGWRDD